MAKIDLAMRELEARKYEKIAEQIDDDPEWFQDTEIDDRDIITALNLAAKAVRRGITC